MIDLFNKVSVLVTIMSVIAFAGCTENAASFVGPDGGNGGTAGSGVPCESAADSTFDAIQDAIFDGRGCTASACHGEQKQSGLDLREGASYDSLVNVPSTRSDKDRVFPGEQAYSFLFEKVEAGTFGIELSREQGQPMPAGGASPLSEDELEALRIWIRAGAPETGVVAGTASLLKCGLPNDADPNKLPVPNAPAAGTGLQLYAGGWNVPAGKENEVCYATYYDFSESEQLPETAKTRCSIDGIETDCIALSSNTLYQDPQSHHSIVDIYYGDTLTAPEHPQYDPAHPTTGDPFHPGWGSWSCLGGENAGLTCDPTKFGVPATAGGAECGDRSACTTPVRTSAACIGWGPFDNRDKTRAFAGAQTPIGRRALPDGVYDAIPAKGFIVWNSHAFNLTAKDTTVEQWINMQFASPDLRQYRAEQLFDSRYIFAMGPIAPFEKNEICATATLPRYTQVIDLSSHVHQRGSNFRIWAPPQPLDCKPVDGCAPDDTKSPFYVSETYNDPILMEFDPPFALDSAEAEMRTYKYCAVFDNGNDDPSHVKKNSAAPDSGICGFPGANCGCSTSERRCLNDPTNLVSCEGDDSLCDTSPGAGDGDCDACPLRGGLTTDDEMFILLGTFFIKPPVE